jgi:hypothetical protein
MNPSNYQFKNEFIINTSVQILDKTCYVLSISEDHDSQYLWVMYKHLRIENVSEIQPMNHRERNEMFALSNQMHPSMSFKSIKIQGQTSKINAAQYFYTSKTNNFPSPLFNHFQNDSFNILDEDTDYYIIRMAIDSLVTYDSARPLALSLKKRDDNIEHLINQEVTFDHENEQFVDIEHPITHQIMTYCFSPMLHYDIWSDLDKNSMSGYSKEQFHNDCLMLCPEDEVMQTIVYKVKEELGLSIYTKEKLASPIHRNHRSPSLSIFLGYEFADNKDLNTFSCDVGHVKPGNKEPVIVEIFSIHIKKEGLWYNVE